jgi:FAD/FMN-containing dehydrogenase
MMGKLKMNKNNPELVCYNTDDSKMFGEASKVIFPKNIEDVKNAVINSQDIIPRGAGKNIVGACIPTNSVVIDMKHMNSINFDFKSKKVSVEPGVTIKELNEKLKSIGYEFPIYSEGTIGGIIAMNSPSFLGGYGYVKEWIDNIEFINGRGELVKFSKSEVGEICGLEGITGIITNVRLNVIPFSKRSASIFQSDNLEEVFITAKRLKLEKSTVMLRLYSPYFSKLLGFPEKYHIIVGFDNNNGMIKGEEYNKLFKKLKKDYYLMNKNNYPNTEDPKFLFEKIIEFAIYLDKLNVPYSGNLNLGIIYPYFNDDLIKKEVINMIERMNGKMGKYGVGLKRKKRVEDLQKKIIKRIKLRHDPFLKFNKGKLIDIEEEVDKNTTEDIIDSPIKKEPLKVVIKDSPENNMNKFIENVEMEDVGDVSIKDNLDDNKVDKDLMDKILFNKGDEDEN